jgi:hypothetical protein
VKTRGQLVAGGLAELLRTYADATLAEVWGTLNQWTELNDPRFGEMSAEKLWQVVTGLAGGNLLPLVRMPTYAQSTCIALMAREALLSPSAPSWVRSPGTSSSEPLTVSSSADALADTSRASVEAPPDVEA